ncbi:MAG: diguanylate cyclase [Gammaproteobacteria bacterium]|nr:diguanylate cyclase [Gammaproteobacteria bacterium]
MNESPSVLHLDTLVRADKLKLLYQQFSPGIISSLASAAVFIIALWPVQYPPVLIVWFLIIFATAAGRYILFIRYRRTNPQGKEILAWEKSYFLTLFSTTLTWGIGSLFIIPADSPIHQVLVLTFMIGLSGGAISLYSAHRLITTTTITILLAPVTVWFLLQGDTLSLVLVTGSIIFFFSLIRAARFIDNTIHNNFTLTSKQRVSEKQLRLAATVFNHSQNGILITGVDGTIVDANPACSEITGYTKEEIIGCNPSIFSSGRHSTAFYGDLWNELIDSGRWQGEIWNRHKDEGIYAQRTSIDAVEDDLGRRSHYVVVFHDISHLKEHEAELREMAYHDVLTGLPNRLLFRDRLELALKQSRRNQRMITVCYLDLDEFKPVNDRFGHHAGDQLLIEVAGRLERAVRESDTVARMGGDEFVILLIDYENSDSVEATVQRILKIVSEPYVMPFGRVTVTASIGVASTTQDTDGSGEILHQADSAMYMAKSEGRNQYQYILKDSESSLPG